MGIKIRYLASAKASATFIYSVERRADETFFDFELDVFRALEDIPASAIAAPLIYHDGAAIADFDHVIGGGAYTVRIYRVGRGDRVVAELPLVIPDMEGYDATSKGAPDMEPSYRMGKKFFNGQTFEAKHRLTFYGNDGFTIHTATLWEDGTTSCNCPTWGPKVDGRRRCKHSERALTLTESIDETGERPVPPPAPTPQDTNPFQRRSRSVDT